MKSTSKVIMGATLVMVMSLAIVLGLILVLLAELYCTLLLRRRQLRITSSNATATTTVATPTTIISPTPDSSSSSQPPQSQNQQSSPPLTTYHAQGVLQAPRSFLFPATSYDKDTTTESINKHSQHHHVLEILSPEPNPKPQLIGVTMTSTPSRSPREIPLQITTTTSNACKEKSCAREHLVYISNPIYDNEASRGSAADTPFETPDSSPSRLEQTGGCSSSGEDEEMSPSSLPVTPPLTPMKKLPAEACSVSLRDASSLGISGSDSVSHNGLSSSSSGSPCTSPSW